NPTLAPLRDAAPDEMGVAVARQENELEEHHGGVPDRRRSTEQGQQELGDERLNPEKQERAEEERRSIERHNGSTETAASVGAMARGVLSRGVVGPDKLGHVTPRLRNCTSRNSSRADLTPGKVEHSERCPGQTVTLRIIFSGGGSPHCEAKPSSAGRRL